MDFYKIQTKLRNYLLQQRDTEGNAVFSEDDFTNDYSNIGLLTNYLSYFDLILENKFKLYRDNSIPTKTTDFNLARQIAKILYNHNWERNRASILNMDLTITIPDPDEDGVNQADIDLVFGANQVITIPKLTLFTIGSYTYYNTDDIVFDKDDIDNGQIVVSDINFQQGTYETFQYEIKNDLLITFATASTIGNEDVFVDVFDSVNNTTESTKYYSDEDFLDSDDTTGTRLYYREYFNDNMILRFNETFAEDLENTRFITVILYRNEGNLSDYNSMVSNISAEVQDESFYPTYSINEILSYEVNLSSSSNGNNYETLQNIQQIGNKTFITKATNANDYNEILKREFGDEYNLNVIGGDNYVEYKMWGYVIFTGIRKDTLTPLSYIDIVKIKTYLDTIKGINLRVIYRIPTIISLKFNIRLTMKLQYKARLDEFRQQVKNNISTYINDTIYSNPIEETKSYVFNNLTLQEDELLDFTDKFDIIQTTNYRFHSVNKDFYDVITGFGTSEQYENLFKFNAFQMPVDDVKALYQDLFYHEDGDQIFIIQPSQNVNFDYGNALLNQTDITYSGNEIFKFSASNFYLLNENTSSNIKFKVKHQIDNDTVISQNLYVNTVEVYEESNLVNSGYLDLPVILYKTSAEQHEINDIKFERDTFVICDPDADIIFD
jgi:hypothetical protein